MNDSKQQPLSIGQRVRVTQAHHDPSRRGREGHVVRVPKLMQDHAYVTLDSRPRERTTKTDLYDNKFLEVIAGSGSPA